MASVTILIPTYNRPNELRRNLLYMKKAENPFPIIVLDGSRSEFRESNKKISNDLGASYPLIPDDYLHFGKRIYLACRDYVKTKYVVIVGDDDFMIPDGVKICADFLDKHDDYSCAIGNTKCLVYSDRAMAKGGFVFQDRLSLPLILKEESFLQRYLRLIAFCDAGCSPLFYGVRRLEHCLEIFKHIESDMMLSAVEQTSNTLTCIFGKTMGLNVEYDIRDFSCPTDRSSDRNDPVTYLSNKDMEKLRPIYGEYLKKYENLSDELTNYVLDQFVKLPLKPVENFQDTILVPPSRFVFLKGQMSRFFGYQISKYVPSLTAKHFNISLKTVECLRYAMTFRKGENSHFKP